MSLKTIGGYFELENRFESEYHSGLIRLNSGRNCLEYILKARNYKKIYLPQYCCSAVLEPILKLQLNFEFYAVSMKLEPIGLKPLKFHEAVLIINYFGLKGKYISSLSQQIPNLIVDNAQAFFEPPIPGVDCFYSARKFFGVPDGAYLSTDCLLENEFPKEVSWERCDHLLRRLENGASDGYESFKINEDYLCGKEIKSMSNISFRLLSGINYQAVKTRRNQNYQYLHLKLRRKNLLTITDAEVDGPMSYPFYSESEGLKEKLIRQKIYVPTYWTNVLELCNSDSVEYQLANKCLPLPIDQRYGLLDMDRICNVLNSLV